MWETKSKVTLKCVVGGERKPEFVLHSIQWVDQTNGRTINTFRDGRTVTDQVREHTYTPAPNLSTIGLRRVSKTGFIGKAAIC